MEAASAEFAASADFVQGLGDTPLGQRLDELADGVDALEAMGAVSWAEIANAIEDVFGSSAADIVDSDPYQETARRLRDSLIAIKVLQQLHSRPIERLTRQLRTAELIADVAAGDTPGETARRRRRSLRLPVELELKSRLSTRDAQQELDKQRQKLVDDRRKRVDELLAEHEALRGAVAELAGLESIHFRATEIVASDHTTVPDVTVLTNAVSSAATYTQVLRAQHLKGQLAREGEEGASLMRELGRCRSARRTPNSRRLSWQHRMWCCPLARGSHRSHSPSLGSCSSRPLPTGCRSRRRPS